MGKIITIISILLLSAMVMAQYEPPMHIEVDTDEKPDPQSMVFCSTGESSIIISQEERLKLYNLLRKAQSKGDPNLQLP